MASLSNINGLFDVHSTGAILFSTSHGTSGQILRSNGNAAPTWVAASTVIGGPYLPLTGGTLSGPLAGTSATFTGAIKQSSRITLNTNGTIQWGSANDYGLLSWDTGYALIYGQSGKGIKFATNGNTLALTLDSSQNATFSGNVAINGSLLTLGSFNQFSGIDTSDLVLSVDKNNVGGGSSFDIQMDGATSAFYINNSRNVGIGTPSPGEKLEVNGVIQIKRIGDHPAIRFVEDTTTRGYIGTGDWAINSGADADLGISSAGTGSLILGTNSGNGRVYIVNGGNVGINDTNPGHALSVGGPAKMAAGLLVGSMTLITNFTAPYFTHLTPNLNVDLNLGNTAFWGHLEVTITGTYSNQNTPGKLTKIYAVGFQPGGTIYTNVSRVSDAMGPVVTQINLGEVRWDSTTSTYRIRIAHIASTGNQYWIQVKGFSSSGLAQSTLPDLGISSIYTQSTSGLNHQQVYYNDRLGVGTDSPTSKLSIRNDGAQLSLQRADALGTEWKFYSWTSGLNIFPVAAAEIYIGRDGATTNLQLHNGILKVLGTGDSYFTGNVGIGTTNPGAKLEVNGDILLTYLKATGNSVIGGSNLNSSRLSVQDSKNGTANSPHFQILGNGYSAYHYLDTTAYNISTNSASREIRIIASTGGVKLTVNATAWVSNSDIALKENIKPLENVLDKIKDYRCVEYNLKESPEDKKIGFIAQDWVDDFPAIVNKDEKNMLGMKYTETIPVLLKAIQELTAKVKELENK
jgi:hypothetical protein